MGHDIFVMVEALNYNGIHRLKDYRLWKSLACKLGDTSTKFEIRCWRDELYAIETGEHFGKQIVNMETQELVFQGEVTEGFIKEISENYLTPTGALKWFTIVFYHQDEMICTCGHYGSEICFLSLPDGEIELTCQWLEKFEEVYRVDVF